MSSNVDITSETYEQNYKFVDFNHHTAAASAGSLIECDKRTQET